MWLQIIRQEETAVPHRETADLITTVRVTAIHEITGPDTEATHGVTTADPVINQWVEAPDLIHLVTGAVLQVTEVVLRDTGEVHQV